MTERLSSWLREDLDRLRELHGDVVDIIGRALPTLVESAEDGRWPYELPRTRPPGESQSTPAMCAYALAVLGKRLPYEIARLPIDAFGRDHLASYDGPGDPPAVLAAANRALARLLVDGDGELALFSKTFGDDDPLTLFYSLALLGSADDLAADLRRLARRRLSELEDRGGDPVLRSATWTEEGEVPPPQPFPHTLPRAYLHRAALWLDDREDGWPDGRPTLTAALDYLRGEFFSQLAYSELRHAEFDAAHFVFALEAMTLIDPEGLTDEQFERALEVVAGAQQRNPGLRPVRPLRRDSQGGANVPVSIEVGAALLRTAVWLDLKRHRLAAFARTLPVLTEYFDWLRSQLVQVQGTTWWGWHSEHFLAHERTANTWYTALALSFLATFAAALERHMATEALRVGRFHRPAREPANWERHKAQDPMVGTDGAYLVYEGIEEAFIEPRHAGGEGSYSMLVHGPPGTGKTTIVKRLAEGLGWDFLVITPSDFVAGGPSEVEARAKDIFTTLGLLTDTVVFFDEIDRLLLDRSSAEYEQQEDMFQFMTPSMLTKLNDLRGAERVIFCIATNYAWRIDPAITRPGRIDERYLLLAPNQAQRRSILDFRVGKEYERRREPPPAGFDATEAARASPWFTFGELKGAVARAMKHEPNDAGELAAALLDEIDGMRPAISLASYEREIDKLKGRGDLPIPLAEEYLMVAWLGLEVEAAANVRTDWIGQDALDQIRDDAIRRDLEELWKKPSIF